MKKSVSRVLCFVICALMLFSFAACGKQEAASSASSTAEATNTTKEEPKKDPVTLKLWHIWTTDVDKNKESMEASIKAVGEQYPDIKLEVDATETEAYKTKLKTAIAANEAPDVFFTWGGGFSKPFINSGNALALDDYMSKYGANDKLLPGALTYQKVNDKTYGMPFTVFAAFLYCNTEMFQKEGLQLPKTYDDLMAAVKAFRAKGITPINVAEKDRWPGMFWMAALSLKSAGLDSNLKVLQKQDTFNQQAYVDAAQKLLDLVKAGAFDKGAMAADYNQAMIPVQQGKVPMIFMGSWANSGFEDTKNATVVGKIEPVPFPSITGAAGKETEFLGGSVDAFMANAYTKYPEEAATVTMAIAENMCKEGFVRGMTLPIWKFDIDKSKVTPMTAKVQEKLANSTGYMMWWDTFLGGADADNTLNSIAQLFGQKISAEDFAKQMQEKVIGKK